MKRHLAKFLIMIILAPALGGCATPTVAPPADISAAAPAQDTLWQVSTLSALMQGVFDGEVSVAQVKEKGDLGVGTFEGVDGEMVVLDGEVYRVRADGKAIKAEDGDKVSFAAVTFFASDQEVTLKDIGSYAALTAELDKIQTNPNIFYAWKISGTFSYMKTRSVPKQTEPYPTLAEVTANQPVFEFQDVKGTLVGLWCPEYVQGVNAAGYHLHFLTEDAQAGGHVLECALREGTAAVDVTTEFAMLLPQNQHFAQTDLSGTAEKDIKKVEGDN
ncbi:MAG TPA: acetolactate decarboxylase [Anaerovoracaceae bacterium]|nr:acetolactate decarboxylase [Anaerovoracaceae bacterium]